jgi:hypothetical protein
MWLREHEFPWDTEVMHAAAYEGHLEILRYAHENECSW